LLQLTSAVSAIPNDGKIMQPYIVEEIIEPDGDVVKMEQQVVAQPISPLTAKQVGSILTEVYDNSIFEGFNSDLREYNIGLKSGTALIPYEDKVGYSDEINTTYVGFDMSEDRKFVLGTWLHKPKEGTLSSQNARTLWIESFRVVKDHLNVSTE
jgi:penicillin-binding protein 2B